MRINNIVTLIRVARRASTQFLQLLGGWQQQRRAALIAFLMLLVPLGPAYADQLDDDLQTVWEALWDQRGTPRQLARWKSDTLPIRYRIKGVEVSRHKDFIVKALDATVASTGLTFTDVSDAPDADTLVQLDFEIVKEIASDPAFGCLVKPVQLDGWHFTKVSVVLRSREVWRCAHHEMMHAMGIPGHPSGNTVLSYFNHRQDQLSALDRVMLKAWYAPDMTTGASPFKALPVLAKYAGQHAAGGRDAQEIDSRIKQFLASTIKSMEDFASGTGEVPTIVRRSGFASENHIAEARKSMMTMLGLAYSLGDGVTANSQQAVQWFTPAADAGHDMAQFALGMSYFKGNGFTQDKAKGYRWLVKAATSPNPFYRDQLADIEKSLAATELEQLRQDAKQ
jgi:hypothetical protein